jgi:urease accessory protein
MTTSGLLLLADGRFPAGGHVHSAGVEAAVSVGDVRDATTLERYLQARLGTTGIVDAAFAAATAVAIVSGTSLAELDAEYSARTPSPYLRHVSRRLGRQLLRAAQHTWRSANFALVDRLPDGVHQPIALGAATVAAGGAATDAATLAIHHLAGAVTSAAVRLLGLDPVGMAALHAASTGTAVETIVATRPWEVVHPSELPALGGSLTEILGEHHGSLDARLFAA